MTKKLRILTSEVTNPWFNLATEDWIFKNLTADSHVLFLWRNSETVVIGNYQNPWTECKNDTMEQDGIFLARRQSGGGAVFHDLGNTNFTFLSPSDDYNQNANFDIIIQALDSLGITATLSGRNDILVDERKISGSAFKKSRDRCFHHGTLLVNANMSKLADYLNPHPLKLQAKGIKSVRSRVANLVEFNPTLNHESISQAIINSFCGYYGYEKDTANHGQKQEQTIPIEKLDENELLKNDTLKDYYDKMADWNWRYGKTPEFTHQMETRFEWGIVSLNLRVKRAIIEEVKVYSDALDVPFMDNLQTIFVGKYYLIAELHQALDDLASTEPQWSEMIGELKVWIKTEV